MKNSVGVEEHNTSYEAVLEKQIIKSESNQFFIGSFQFIGNTVKHVKVHMVIQTKHILSFVKLNRLNKPAI